MAGGVRGAALELLLDDWRHALMADEEELEDIERQRVVLEAKIRLQREHIDMVRKVLEEELLEQDVAGRTLAR